MIKIENRGPAIVSTNFWETDLAKGGKLFCSCNAGCIRILLPANLKNLIAECRSASYVILSRGAWPAENLPEAVELLFEDESDKPMALMLSPESFDLLPARPPQPRGRGWNLSIWIEQPAGKPCQVLELPVRWRAVVALPYMKPWPRERGIKKKKNKEGGA